MPGCLHALNVTTLATWLSVAGLGAVAAWSPEREDRRPAKEEALVAEWIEPEILIGGEDAAAGDPAPAGQVADPTEAVEPLVPAPPELPEMAAMEPLPEIPELPALVDSPVAVAEPEASGREAVQQPAARPSRRTEASATTGGGAARGGSPGATGTGGGGTGMSQGARLAAGRMPPPVYPAEARRRNQEGTVMIAFTVDANGSVISARVAKGSPWPLLNDAAVRAVRRWRFPAGQVMSLQQPVVFQLR